MRPFTGPPERAQRHLTASPCCSSGAFCAPERSVVGCGARASRVSRARCCPATPPPTPRAIGRRPAPARAL
eukprot:215941-Prymnesium_polylepis.1